MRGTEGETGGISEERQNTIEVEGSISTSISENAGGAGG